MTKKEKNEKNLQLLVSKLDSDVEFYDQFIEDWIQFRLDSYKELRAKYNLRKIDIVYLKNKYNITIPQEVVTAKTKQTRLERYGDENYNNTEKFKHTRHSKTKEEELEITNKRRKTCLEKYGVSSVQLIPGVQDKKKETFLEKYGVEHPMKSDVCKNKSIQTCMEKYGVEYALQSDEVKEKGRKTKLEKYGDENYNNQEKQKNTFVERYGYEHSAQCPEIKAKTSATIKERYGYDWFCMTPEAKKYNGNDSSYNRIFASILDENHIEYSREFPIMNKSFDFKVSNTLIEINPSPTHNSTWGIFGKPLDKKYHYEKTKLAKENGYRCINVWDWDDVDKIIYLISPMEKVYARNCDIKIVDKKIAKEFIEKYHLQGYAKDDIRLGLYYCDVLVSIMTFDKPRYNKNYEYELIRYCSCMHVVGGAEKLFKHFIKSYMPKTIISYCDCSKFTGDTYEKLGFVFKNISIGCHWYNLKTQRHITDNLLRARGVDQLLGTNYGKGTDNRELMRLNGFVEVYDAGQAVYEYKLRQD